MSFPEFNFSGHSNFVVYGQGTTAGAARAEALRKADDLDTTKQLLNDFAARVFKNTPPAPQLVVASHIDRQGKKHYNLNQQSFEIWTARATAAVSTLLFLHRIGLI